MVRLLRKTHLVVFHPFPELVVFLEESVAMEFRDLCPAVDLRAELLLLVPIATLTAEAERFPAIHFSSP